MNPILSNTLLLLHLTAAILWIGPALGGWVFVFRNEQRERPNASRWDNIDDFVMEQFLSLVRLEHLAFFALIVTGFLRAWTLGWGSPMLSSPATPLWLKLKLAIVVFVIAPFELWDAWVAHWKLPQAIARKEHDAEALRQALRLHALVSRIGALVLAIAIPVVLFAVTFRP